MTLSVEPPEMRGVGSRLSSAATDLDSAGKSSPDSIDAGIMAAVITGTMAGLTKAAAAAAQGLDAAGIKLHECLDDYETCDANVGSALHNVGRAI